MTEGCCGVATLFVERVVLLLCFAKNAGILVGRRGRSALTNDEEQKGETTHSFSHLSFSFMRSAQADVVMQNLLSSPGLLKVTQKSLFILITLINNYYILLYQR